MPRKPTGELVPLAHGWELRLRVTNQGDRKAFLLSGVAPHDEGAARERQAKMATMAERLRRAGHEGNDLVKLPEVAATAKTPRALEAALGAADVLCAGTSEPISEAARVTVEAFGKDWTSGKLRERWPDHVREKRSSHHDERILRMYVVPVIGGERVASLTLDMMERVMERLPAHLSSASRRHVAQVLHRLAALAVYPGRPLRENPIPRGWLPRVRSRVSPHLYPREEAQLLGCTGVDLLRRLFYGVLAREGLRKSEAGSLCWRDVDLERGAVRLDVNKTSDPRAWALRPDVAAALRKWKVHFRPEASDDDHVFAYDDGPLLNTEPLPGMIKDDLRLAKVTRPELYEDTTVRKPVCVHSLRASFVTEAKANGRTESWIADRTGHRSSIMINRYNRVARTWAELGLGTYTALDQALPELAGLPDQCPTDNQKLGISRDLGSRIEPNSRTIRERAGNHPPLKSSSREGVPVRPREGPPTTHQSGHQCLRQYSQYAHSIAVPPAAMHICPSVPACICGRTAPGVDGGAAGDRRAE